MHEIILNLHMHTRYSDGTGSHRDIARAAIRAGLEAVIVTDLDNDDQTPDDYNDRITLWLSRNLPMICANPDRVVEHGDQLIYCGGALADLYEARGGMINMAGKP